jgi:hypothetical protein
LEAEVASPLQLEVGAYQDALQRYNLAVANFNRKTKLFNESVVRDADGRALVKDANKNKVYAVDPISGKLSKTSLPFPYTFENVGVSALPDENKVQLLRTSREAATNYNNPGDFTQAPPGSPSMTFADARALQSGTASQRLAAEARGGLLSDVIRSQKALL